MLKSARDGGAEEAVRAGTRIGVAATPRTPLEPALALLGEKAADAGREVDLIESLSEGAFQAVIARTGSARHLFKGQAS